MNTVIPVKNRHTSIHIILVDNDLGLLNITKQLLEVLGYIVTSAAGSDEAIRLIKSFIFDVMITDYDMPEINGVALAIKAKKLLVKTPIILYTGNIGSIDDKKIAEAGIAEVVRKPCNIRDLDMTIKRTLGMTERVSLLSAAHAPSHK